MGRFEAVLAILSGVAVFNAFVGGVLMVSRKGPLKNTLLGLMLIAITLRIGKSIIILFEPSIDDSVPAIGILGMAAVGPLFLFYLLSVANVTFRFRTNHFLHFAPSVVVGVILPFSSSAVIFWLYAATCLQLALYLIYVTLKKNSLITAETRNWITIIQACLSVLCLVFSLQLFIDSLSLYFLVTLVAVVSLIIVFSYGITHGRIFIVSKPKVTDKNKMDAINQNLLQLMEQDKVYRDVELSLNKLANKLGTKAYVLSNVINRYHGTSFTEFINSYRLAEAERILESVRGRTFSIDAISFDSGFNSPATFYTAFKKKHKITPAEFRSRGTRTDEGQLELTGAR